MRQGISTNGVMHLIAAVITETGHFLICDTVCGKRYELVESRSAIFLLCKNCKRLYAS